MYSGKKNYILDKHILEIIILYESESTRETLKQLYQSKTMKTNTDKIIKDT